MPKIITMPRANFARGGRASACVRMYSSTAIFLPPDDEHGHHRMIFRNRRWHSISPPRFAGHAAHAMPSDLLGEEKLKLEAQLPGRRQVGPLHVVEGLELG